MNRLHLAPILLAALSLSALSLAACSAGAPPANTADHTAGEIAPAEPVSSPAEAEHAQGSDSVPVDEEDAWEGEADAVASGGESHERNLSEGETRTMQVIQQTVLKNRDAVRACYDAVQEKIPSLKGDMTISFVIDPEGVVKHAELNLAKSTLKNPELAKCAIEEIKRIEFPPSSKGLESKVNYPFNLNPR